MLLRSSLINEHFWTKGQARAAVSFLAVVKMLEKKYMDRRLNPRRTKDRLKVSPVFGDAAVGVGRAMSLPSFAVVVVVVVPVAVVGKGSW